MSDYPAITLATLTVVKKTRSPNDPSLKVHFNPASLQLTLSSELKDNNKAGPKQYIAKATAKLKFDLIFDTTHTGESVLKFTKELQALVIPPNFKAPSKSNPTQVPPPRVAFDWGALAFQGVAEAYQETIDFFSADGVPLRATVSMTLSQQDSVFEDRSSKKVKGGVEDDGSGIATGENSPAGAAAAADAPDAARGVAMANGAESLRATFTGSLSVGASVELGGPVAFASAGGSFGASASGGLGLELGASASAGISGGISGAISGGLSAGASGGGLSAGISGGLSAGISGGFGAGASVSGGISGGFGVSGSASVSGLAGLSATEGAFAGLNTSASMTVSGPRLDVDAFRARAAASASVSTDAGASFRVGGRATFSGPAGLRADVGAAGRLSFDPD